MRVMDAGTYETGTGTLPSGGLAAYISAVQLEELGALALIPSSISGGSSTYYLCDQFTPPAATAGICIAGGSWTKGAGAGISNKSVSAGTSYSSAALGCRIEYIPQS